ncbi:unnamed protein product [Amoebophrya sp. A25]|nr:unnamed protein product [Amoebophrya sp. A25]|eukprot:GSA25T00007176001.1
MRGGQVLQLQDNKSLRDTKSNLPAHQEFLQTVLLEDQPPIGDCLLEEIRRAADLLVQQTPPRGEGTTLFIGQSADYLRAAVGRRRATVSLPMGGVDMFGGLEEMFVAEEKKKTFSSTPAGAYRLHVLDEKNYPLVCLWRHDPDIFIKGREVLLVLLPFVMAVSRTNTKNLPLILLWLTRASPASRSGR